MKFTLCQRLVIILLVAVFCETFFIRDGFGSEHRLLTRLTLGEEYNTNIFWSTQNRETDWMLTVSPYLTWESRSPLNTLSAEAGIDFVNYKRNDELNTNKGQYTVMYNTCLTPLLRGNLTGSLLKDTTFESEVEETGTVYSQSGRRRYTGGPQLTWLLSERSQFSFSYNYFDISYDSSSYTDYQTHEGTIIFSHQMHDEKTTFSWNNGYARYDFNNQYNRFTDNYHSLLGIDYQLRKLLKVSINSGIRYSKTRSEKDTYLSEMVNKTERSGFSGITLHYERPRNNIAISFNKDISPSGSYGTITQERVDFTTAYHFLHTTTGTLRWVRSISTSDDYSSGLPQKHKDNYVSYSISLTHRLRKQIFIEIRYIPQLIKKSTMISNSSGVAYEERRYEEQRRDTIFLKLGIDYNYKIQ